MDIWANLAIMCELQLKDSLRRAYWYGKYGTIAEYDFVNKEKEIDDALYDLYKHVDYLMERCSINLTPTLPQDRI